MKKTLLILASLLLTLPHTALADVEEKLEKMGIKLYPYKAPTNSYVHVVKAGKMVFTSGHGPKKADGSYVLGKVGKDLTVEEGAAAARLSGIAILSSLKHELGDLDRIKRIVKVLGMVNATEDFKQHSTVINGFSNLMIDVFGDKGKHARSAVGMQSLPIGFATEIEVVIELYDE
jgi:enamine deaminase RidA (YjgF/YER057c/UK114 family)